MEIRANSFLLSVNKLRLSTKFQRSLFVWISLIPICGFFIVIWIYPILSSLFLSLHNWGLITGQGPFIGFENYISALQDHSFWISLGNTVFYVVFFVAIVMVISLGAALFVTSMKDPWKSIVMVLFFIPTITSMIIAALTFEVMYVPGYGVINYLGSLLGIPAISWTSHQLIKPAIIVFMVWKYFGFYMVLYVTGLYAIPHEFVEASQMDGANSFQVFRFIKLPLLSPILTFNIVTASISTFQIFGPIYALQRSGGSSDSAMSLVVYLYKQAFSSFDLGYGSSIAFILFLIIFGLSIFEMRSLREQYEY